MVLDSGFWTLIGSLKSNALSSEGMGGGGAFGLNM